MTSITPIGINMPPTKTAFVGRKEMSMKLMVTVLALLTGCPPWRHLRYRLASFCGPFSAIVLNA